MAWDMESLKNFSLRDSVSQRLIFSSGVTSVKFMNATASGEIMPNQLWYFGEDAYGFYIDFGHKQIRCVDFSNRANDFIIA